MTQTGRMEKNRKPFENFLRNFFREPTVKKTSLPGDRQHPDQRWSTAVRNRHSMNPAGSSCRSPFQGSRSQNRPSFHFRCSCMIWKDFRLPIAYISPDFFSRRRKTYPGLIQPRKSPHCTFISEFPGFWRSRKLSRFQKSSKMNSF